MQGIKYCFLISIMILCGTSPLVAHAEPPRVKLTVPAHGDIQVDPSLSIVRVEFDQKMSIQAWSFVGGGPTFPPTRGRPSWLNSRVCVLPVKLEPNHFYQFRVNSDRFTNFRNLDGEPAIPQLVQFITASTDDAPVENALNEVINRESIEALREAIDAKYSYRDRLGLDWDALFALHEADLLGAQRPIAFALRASLMLAEARDMHISVVAKRRLFGTHYWSGQRNYNFEALNEMLTNLQQPNRLVQHGLIGDDIGYLRINSWDGLAKPAMQAALEAIESMHNLPALIVDVRANGGGDEMLAKSVAGCFIDEPKVYSKNDYRDPTRPGGFSNILDRIVHPNTDVPTYQGKVVVLIGNRVCSSNESFVAMMQQAADCTLVGMRTYGSSGNPKRYRLPNGVTVTLPSWRDYLADGTLLEGRGIEPDLPVKTAPSDFNDADPVFEQAIRHLRR